MSSNSNLSFMVSNSHNSNINSINKGKKLTKDPLIEYNSYKNIELNQTIKSRILKIREVKRENMRLSYKIALAQTLYPKERQNKSYKVHLQYVKIASKNRSKANYNISDTK